MAHQAFAFDWEGFARSLRLVLLQALDTGGTAGLVAYIEAHRERLTDPYEGEPLDDDWQESLENRDVHEFGDYALTEFYDPTSDAGLSYAWAELSETVEEDGQLAFLGSPLGAEGRWFDPGRMGSYFQTPAEVQDSLRAVQELELPEVEPFRELLQRCVDRGLGLYVTF